MINLPLNTTNSFPYFFSFLLQISCLSSHVTSALCHIAMSPLHYTMTQTWQYDSCVKSLLLSQYSKQKHSSWYAVIVWFAIIIIHLVIVYFGYNLFFRKFKSKLHTTEKKTKKIINKSTNMTYGRCCYCGGLLLIKKPIWWKWNVLSPLQI